MFPRVYFPGGAVEILPPPPGGGGIFGHRLFAAALFPGAFFCPRTTPVSETPPPEVVGGGPFPPSYFSPRLFAPVYFPPDFDE